MKFSAQQDVEAPIKDVFAAITRHDVYERAAMRRGADVVRKDGLGAVGVGACWHARFVLRGKERDLGVEVTTFTPPSDMVLTLRSRSVSGAVRFELFALSKTRTRMAIVTEIQPITMAARLFLQSLTLTKGALNKRYETRIMEFAAEIKARSSEPRA